MAASFEVLKPEIEKHVRYLKSCVKQKFFSKKKMAGEQTGTVLDRLHEFVTFEEEGYTFGVGFVSALGKYLVKEGVCITFMQLWKHLFKYANKDKSASQGGHNFATLIGVCWNLTDACREFGDELVGVGFVPILLDAIDNNLDHIDGNGDNDNADNKDNGDDKDDELGAVPYTIDAIFSILHNSIRLGMSNQHRDVYRRANAVSVLQRCLKSSSYYIQLFGLIVLAYVVKENEREILATSKVGLCLLLVILKSAVETDNHRGIMEFSAFETLDAINHLAINDTNKAAIEKQGAIPTIVRMLQDDFSDEERRVAAETLWNLSFVESIRESEIVQNTIPTLEKLVKSDNKELRGACASALWEIKARTPEGVSASLPSPVEDSPPTYEEATADAEPTEAAPTKTTELGTSAKSGPPMIMLSYQWDSQQLVLKIKDRLEMAGWSVWMDINNIEGDILGAMAKAVKTSDVILMCMSERYQESRSCRSGPIQPQEQQICQVSPPVNASSPPVQAASPPVQAESPPVQAESPPVQAESPPMQAVSRSTSVDQWSKSDVQNWLHENDLGDICPSLASVKGKHLRKLNTQREQNEREFKEEMKSDYKIFGRFYLLFTDALEELFPK